MQNYTFKVAFDFKTPVVAKKAASFRIISCNADSFSKICTALWELSCNLVFLILVIVVDTDYNFFMKGRSIHSVDTTLKYNRGEVMLAFSSCSPKNRCEMEI